VNSTITVEMNDLSVEIESGSSLNDLFKKTHTSYVEGATIGIVKGGEKKEEQTTEYSVRTNKGEFKIEVDSEKPELMSTWLANFIGKQLNAHWATPDAVAFGPIKTDIKPDRSAYEYQRYDVIFGAGGYDARNTYVLIAKGRHIASHGSPAKGGVFARVISGKNIISKLDQGDTISQIEPVIRWETLTDKITTSDLNTPLEDGMKIFTFLLIDLKKESPIGAEHFLGLVRDGLFRIDEISSSYVANTALQSEECPFELLDSRSEGSVAVRTKGDGMGKVFISKEDRTSSPVHSIVGNVVKGVELAKLAENGNRLAVRVNPEQVMFLGMNIHEAVKMAEARGLVLEIDGYEAEDAIVVEQLPETTMEIIESKKVSVLGIPPELLIHIKLYYDKAPKTIEFFKHALRLKGRPVGPLPVYFNYENTTLFKTIKRAESYKEIMPENTPTDKVLAGEMGVTNQASNQYGLIGLKTVDDERYGPSGEKFHSTNIIGKVLDADKLKTVKQGDFIYVMEVK
jgi:putative methanogenesis marker protein 3